MRARACVCVCVTTARPLRFWRIGTGQRSFRNLVFFFFFVFVSISRDRPTVGELGRTSKMRSIQVLSKSMDVIYYT